MAYDRDDRATLTSLSGLSFHTLAARAIEENFIDSVVLRSDRVEIVQRDRRFAVPHRQACTFLIGMLSGRSWYVGDSDGLQRRPQ